MSFKVHILLCCFLFPGLMLYSQVTLKGKIRFKQQITDVNQRNVKGASFINYPAVGVKVVLVNRDRPGNKLVFSTIENLSFNCEASLNRLLHQATYTNTEGYYYFKNVLPGRYIIKVCESNGNFYRFRVSSRNNYLLVPEIEATQIEL